MASNQSVPSPGGPQGSGPSPSASSPDNPEVAWWCKLLTRAVATVGGVVALILGIISCISVTALCIIAGLLQIGAALLLLLFEAPFCCQFFNYAKPLVAFADRRSFMQKALIYVALSIPPVGLCFGFVRLVGCGLIFATGVLYGLMSLGKKADRETMIAQARGSVTSIPTTTTDDKVILVPSMK